MGKTKKSAYEKALEIVIVIVIVGILWAMRIPSYKKGGRPVSREKACFSNQRVITGAVEMYNMDNVAMMKTLDMDLLVKGKYLKSKPQLPEPDCEYYSIGDLATDTGFITCRHHGDIEGRDRKVSSY